MTYPAHWGPTAVEALGSALSRVTEWSNPARPLTLIPDAAATLFAVRANPGIPARGTVAVCDFGGSGTSITLIDAAGDYQPLAPTVRHHDFSGDLIDQALLTTVMANVPSTGAFDPSGTSAIGSLSRLRAGCRVAKEQLSSSTVTTLTEELPGVDGDIRLTRNELDDAIRDSLNNFVSVLDEALVRNGIRAIWSRWFRWAAGRTSRRSPPCCRDISGSRSSRRRARNWPQRSAARCGRRAVQPTAVSPP